MIPEQVSGDRKISLKEYSGQYLKLEPESSAKLLGLVQGEQFEIATFCRNQKNLIYVPDSNLYLTNKRVSILTGNKMTDVWFKDLTKVELVKSSLLETIWGMQRYLSFRLTYRSRLEEKSIRVWCSTRVIGGAPAPLNDTTEGVFMYIVGMIDHDKVEVVDGREEK